MISIPNNKDSIKTQWNSNQIGLNKLHLMEMEWNAGSKFNICELTVFVLIIHLLVHHGLALADKYHLVQKALKYLW